MTPGGGTKIPQASLHVPPTPLKKKDKWSVKESVSTDNYKVILFKQQVGRATVCDVNTTQRSE